MVNERGDDCVTWKTVKLGDVCKFLNGGTPSKEISKYFDGHIPWITGADIISPIVTNARSFITDEAIQSSATNLVQKDTVLLVTRTSVGKVAVTGLALCFSQDITAIIPHQKELNSKFLVRFLESKTSYFKQYQRGATIQGITRDVVANLQIPLPPLAEQKRIAEVLDKADALREKRRLALNKLDSLTQSIFLEMFGDPVKNPKGWERVILNEISNKITDGEHQTPKRISEGIKLLSARNVKNGFIDLSQVDYISIDEYERIIKRCNPEKNDILISCSGTIGRVTTVQIDEKFTLVRSVALVKPKDNVNAKFLENYLRTDYMKAFMIKRANASSQANLFIGQIKELPILLPPLELQNKFAEIVKKIEALKAEKEKSLEQIENLFQSLQQRAFKGELFDSRESEVESQELFEMENETLQPKLF